MISIAISMSRGNGMNYAFITEESVIKKAKLSIMVI